jgi:hypothetical protein
MEKLTKITRGKGLGKYESLIEVFDGNSRVWAGLCSSLPDYPQGSGKSNECTPEATILNGKYKLLTKHQKINGVNWRVLEVVNLDKSQNVPVVRSTGYDTSAGINIHYRDAEDYDGFAWSTGCITMRRQTFDEFREALGVPKEGFEVGKDFGILEITGSVLEELYAPYRIY